MQLHLQDEKNVVTEVFICCVSLITVHYSFHNLCKKLNILALIKRIFLT